MELLLNEGSLNKRTARQWTTFHFIIFSHTHQWTSSLKRLQKPIITKKWTSAKLVYLFHTPPKSPSSKWWLLTSTRSSLPTVIKQAAYTSWNWQLSWCSTLKLLYNSFVSFTTTELHAHAKDQTQNQNSMLHFSPEHVSGQYLKWVIKKQHWNHNLPITVSHQCTVSMHFSSMCILGLRLHEYVPG